MINLPNKFEVKIAHINKSGFAWGIDHTPGINHMLTIKISKNIFNDHALYQKHKEGQIWWAGGMQKWTSGEIYLVSDDLDDGIFPIFFFQNNFKYPFMLGKLISDNEFYNRCYQAMVETEMPAE